MTGRVAVPAALAALEAGIAGLEAGGVESPRRDAEWLLAAVLGTRRFDAYLDPGRGVAPAAEARYRALIARRAAREPLQYLAGFEDFHGLRLALTRDVLIPRPETEGLVAWALALLRERPRATVADVGTGSGAIACALAAALPGIEVLAVDCSSAALAVAEVNVQRLGLQERVRLLAGDLLAPLTSVDTKLDLVVANPPYIPSAMIDTLPPEVSRHEPRLALDGGPDGMDVLRRLVHEAPARLAPGGWLLLEIGEGQAERLAARMADLGFVSLEVRCDLRRVERYLGGRWPRSETDD